MLSNIRNLFYLVDFPVKTKLALSVVGAFIVSLLEIFGVAATYPLILLVSGQSIENGPLATLAQVLGTTDRQRLIALTGIIVVSAFIGKSLFTIGFRWWQSGFVNKMELSARVNLLGLYLDSPYPDYKKRELSKIHTNLVTSMAQAYRMSIFGGLSLLTNLMTITLMLVIVFILSPQVALIAVPIFGAVGYAIPALSKRRLEKISHEMTKADQISWFSSMPALSAFREMRLFSVGNQFVEKYKRGVEMSAKAQRQQGLVNELPKNIMEIVFIVSIASLAVFMFSTRDQAEAIATMGVFSVAAVRLMPAINSAMASLNVVRSGTAGVLLLNREIEYFKGISRYSALPSSNTVFTGDVDVQGVSFQYDPAAEPVLKNISISIPANKTVAFVGSSGSGKSTLVDIILGMLPPTQGSVTCGGIPISADLKAWQQQLGVVPQSVYVLPGNLKENVAFGLPETDIDDAQVISALAHAELNELVDSLPNGITEDLGQDGGRLSGGQRQRLGIARALYRTPKLLVLDEATSALDNKTEHKITQTIEGLAGEMTIVMVAHRLSTIKKADIIYYMKNGEVVNQGSFEELSELNPEFKELVELGKL